MRHSNTGYYLCVHLSEQGKRESDVVCVQLAPLKIVESVCLARICQSLAVQVVRSNVVNSEGVLPLMPTS